MKRVKRKGSRSQTRARNTENAKKPKLTLVKSSNKRVTKHNSDSNQNDNNIENRDPKSKDKSDVEVEKVPEINLRSSGRKLVKNRNQLEGPKVFSKPTAKFPDKNILKKLEQFHILKRQLLAPFMAQLFFRFRFNDLMDGLNREETIAFNNTHDYDDDDSEVDIPPSINAGKKRKRHVSEQEDWISQGVFSDSD